MDFGWNLARYLKYKFNLELTKFAHEVIIVKTHSCLLKYKSIFLKYKSILGKITPFIFYYYYYFFCIEEYHNICGRIRVPRLCWFDAVSVCTVVKLGMVLLGPKPSAYICKVC